MTIFLFKDLKLSEKLFVPKHLLDDYSLIDIFSKAAKFFRLTARDQEQVFVVLKTVLLTSDKNEIHYILLLLLICLKQRFESECHSKNIHVSPWKLDEFIKEQKILGKINEVEMLSMFWNGDHRKKAKITLTEIFLHYVSLMDGDLNKTLANPHAKQGFEFKTDIARQLGKGKNHDGYGKFIEKHDLESYFKLLFQAGRIVVN
jgi:hypothetical protein